jgi:uncharacterized protein (DUF4415 family)
MKETHGGVRKGRPRNPIEKVSFSIRLEAELVHWIVANEPDWRESIANVIRREFVPKIR